MGDEVKSNLQLGQPGQAVTSPKTPSAPTGAEATPATATGQEQKPLTRADVFAIIREEFPRLSMSHADRTAAKVSQEIQRLQKAGIQITPEQAETLVLAEEAAPAISHTPEPSKRTPAPVQSEGEKEQPDPIVVVAHGIISKAGLDVERDFSDEEKQFFSEAEDEAEFLSRVKQAVTEKRNKRGTPSRNPSIMGGGRVSTGKASLVEEMGRLLENPTKNMLRIKELNAQLHK